MKLKKKLKDIIIIDKKIFRIYENMTVNDYQFILNDEKIKELKELVNLEKWAYNKLNLNYEEINEIINELDNLCIGDKEEKIQKLV